MLDSNDETFIISVTFLISSNLSIDVYVSYKIQIALLIIDEASTIVSFEYVYFANIFSLDFVAKLLNHFRIKNYPIDLVQGQQLPDEPIYSPKLVELETLKTYIKTNLANSFIRPFKSPVTTPIFLAQKLNNSS